jgi:hypothetical protein
MSEPTTTRYIIRHVKVERCECIRRATRAYRVPGSDEPVVEYEDLGWFIHLAGSSERLYLGQDEPTLGTHVRITLEADDPPGDDGS